MTFDLSVRVYGFMAPSASPPAAGHHLLAGGLARAGNPRRRPNGARRRTIRPTPWKKHKARWADFLADYYITYDSLYHHHTKPDFEVLRHLQAQNRLGLFNLGYWYYFDPTEASRAAWQANTLRASPQRLRPSQELGLHKQAYIYGCDEVVWASSRASRRPPRSSRPPVPTCRS